MIGIFKEIPISIKSEIYYFKHDLSTTQFHIQQVYRAGLMTPLIFEEIGLIVENIFIDYRETAIASQRRQNLFGLNLNASMVVTNNETLLHLTDYRLVYSLHELWTLN